MQRRCHKAGPWSAATSGASPQYRPCKSVAGGGRLGVQSGTRCPTGAPHLFNSCLIASSAGPPRGAGCKPWYVGAGDDLRQKSFQRSRSADVSSCLYALCDLDVRARALRLCTASCHFRSESGVQKRHTRNGSKAAGHTIDVVSERLAGHADQEAGAETDSVEKRGSHHEARTVLQA